MLLRLFLHLLVSIESSGQAGRGNRNTPRRLFFKSVIRPLGMLSPCFNLSDNPRLFVVSVYYVCTLVCDIFLTGARQLASSMSLTRSTLRSCMSCTVGVVPNPYFRRHGAQETSLGPPPLLRGLHIVGAHRFHTGESA